MAVQTQSRPARTTKPNGSHSIVNEAPASMCSASHHDVLTPINPRPIHSIASATISDDQRLADEAGGGWQAGECGERVRDDRLCGGRNGRGDRDRENRVPGTSSACLSAAISVIRRGRHWFAACVAYSGVSAQPAYSRTAIKASAQGFTRTSRRPKESRLRNNNAQPVRRYDLLSDVGAATTCPSFTGSVGPGLNDVRTTPFLPSRR